MSLVGFSTEGRSVIFSADSSGDEKQGFYRLTLATGKVISLKTPAQSRDSPMLVGNVLFYAEREQASSKTRIMKLPIDAKADAEVLCQDEGLVYLADVINTQQRLLLIRYQQRQSQELLLVDLTSPSHPTKLLPTAKEASVEAAAFTADGDVLFTTDDGGEQTQLVWLVAPSASNRGWNEKKRPVEKKFPFAKADSLLVKALTMTSV